MKTPHPDPLPRGEGEEHSAPPLPPGEGRGEGRRLIARARALRRDLTPAERRLWNAIRNGALGAKCRRQSPLGPYVLDFLFYTERLAVELFYTERLAVELDGESHNAAGATTRDARRDAWLRAHGIRVLRFVNRDVLGNLEGVVEAIRMALRDTPSPPSPSPRPSPKGRGDAMCFSPSALGEGRGEGPSDSEGPAQP